jgi:hypothetical protein
MRNRILPIFAAFVLALCVPLSAQMPEPDPVPVEEEVPIEETYQQEQGENVPLESTEEDVTTQETLESDIASSDEERELPETASPLALLAVLGAAAAVAASGIRRTRRN